MNEFAAEPSLDTREFMNELIKGMGFEGEPGVQQLQTFMRARAAKDMAMAEKIRRVFAEGDGAEVLEWLVDLTLRRDEVPVDELMTLRQDQVAMKAVFRAGENSVVKQILHAMAQAEQKRTRRRRTT